MRKNFEIKERDIVYLSNGLIIQANDVTMVHDLPKVLDKVIKIERPIQYETVYQITTLTQEHKEYLENVIRPFRQKVTDITKQYNRDNLFVTISYESYEHKKYKYGTIYLPIEENDFAEMELNKIYTIQELGLFKGETE